MLVVKFFRAVLDLDTGIRIAAASRELGFQWRVAVWKAMLDVRMKDIP